MIAFALAVVVFLSFGVGFVCGRLYRGAAQEDALFWEQKAKEYHEGWLAASKRAADLERALEAGRQ